MKQVHEKLKEASASLELACGKMEQNNAWDHVQAARGALEAAAARLDEISQAQQAVAVGGYVAPQEQQPVAGAGEQQGVTL